MKQIEQYQIAQFRLQGSSAQGIFRLGSHTRKAHGFQSGENEVSVRMMPDTVGTWQYEIISDEARESGTFVCVPARQGSHGPVLAEGRHFRHMDGTRFLPFGTTCYAWIHQPESLRQQTLASLKSAPFNKVRMCLFPKHMPYSHNEPDQFPFHLGENGGWDMTKPNFAFWDDLDRQIAALDELGIQADLILFHPYDRWGFATLSREECLTYLDYCVSRLSAFQNIWWSMSNEYDLVPGKTEEDWDVFAQRVRMRETAVHLISIHNYAALYPDRDWMTHCSIQTQQCRQTLTWGWEYQKPVIIDECGYEGNIEFTWGNLSPFELVHRFWIAVACGGYCTHGETFYREDEVLWWAKGGKLYGKSGERITFLRDLLESLPGYPETAIANLPIGDGGTANEEMSPFGLAAQRLPEGAQAAFIAEMIPMVCGSESWRLYYLGRACPAWADVQCPGEGAYQAEVIDIWEMTRTVAMEHISGSARIKLPGKEGQAVLIQKKEAT